MEGRNCGELIRGTKEPWALPRRESPDHRRSNEKGERGKAWRKKKKNVKTHAGHVKTIPQNHFGKK